MGRVMRVVVVVVVMVVGSVSEYCANTGGGIGRFRRLRTPANTFIVNLAASDLITSVLHSMAAYSSFRHQWSFGRLGMQCEMYNGDEYRREQ
ncbi:Melanopsin [Portunus trituberculatus]|uniref:Melanopsin n=1 Tax=Portunus trituberculatus TaxID=210409 RepID=A0A5B7ICN8_PORTR|nr:Melanopsin [Portunus trituberculatus]